MQILLLNGHDNFGNGGDENKLYGSEQSLTRDFSNFLKLELDRVGNNTTIFNPDTTDKSAYSILKSGGTIPFTKYDYVIELHFNSKGGDMKKDGMATGTEILIHVDNANDVTANDILNAISDIGLKSRGIKKRSDLLVMNTVVNKRVPYMLWEICFIDDNDDMEYYMSRRQLLAKTFAKQFSTREYSLYTVNVGDNTTLPIYLSPNNTSMINIITHIPNHSELSMIELGNDWCKVSYNNIIGYVQTSKLYKTWKGYTTANLNVRENASKSSKSICILNKGTVVNITHTRKSPTGDNWLFAKANIINKNTNKAETISGYVHPDYVKLHQ